MFQIHGIHECGAQHIQMLRISLEKREMKLKRTLQNCQWKSHFVMYNSCSDVLCGFCVWLVGWFVQNEIFKRCLTSKGNYEMLCCRGCTFAAQRLSLQKLKIIKQTQNLKKISQRENMIPFKNYYSLVVLGWFKKKLSW